MHCNDSNTILYTTHGYYILVSDLSSWSDGPRYTGLWLAVPAFHRSQLSSHSPPLATPHLSYTSSYNSDSVWLNKQLFGDNTEFYQFQSLARFLYFHQWILEYYLSSRGNQLLISERETEPSLVAMSLCTLRRWTEATLSLPWRDTAQSPSILSNVCSHGVFESSSSE